MERAKTVGAYGLLAAVFLFGAAAGGVLIDWMRSAEERARREELAARADYLHAFAEGFTNHRLWRSNRLIQAYLIECPPPTMSGPIGEDLDCYSGSLSCGLSFTGVPCDPELGRELRREVLSCLAAVLEDMLIFSGLRFDGGVRTFDDHAGLHSGCGWAWLAAEWKPGNLPGDLTTQVLLVELVACLTPQRRDLGELRAEASRYEREALTELRHYKGLKDHLYHDEGYDPVPGLASGDPVERARAAVCLWRKLDMGTELGQEATRALFEAVEKEEDPLRAPVLFLPLERSRERAVMERLFDIFEGGREELREPAFRTLLRLEGADDEWWQAFGRRQEALAGDARDRYRRGMLEALSHGDAAEHKSAVSWAVGRVYGDAEAAEALLDALLAEPDAGGRVENCISQCFRTCGHRAVMEKLFSALGHERVEIWSGAADALAANPNWRDEWRSRKEKAEGVTRLRMLAGEGDLSGLGEELEARPEETWEFLTSLVDLKTYDRSSGLFTTACSALAAHGGKRALPVLVHAFHELDRYGKLRDGSDLPAQFVMALNRLAGRDYGGVGADPGKADWRELAKVDWNAVLKELRRDFP